VLNKKDMIAVVGRQYDDQIKSFVTAHPEMTYLQIARFFGASVDVVYRIRRQYDLPHRPKGPRPPLKQAVVDRNSPEDAK
jgi:hypothetical protein